jgi:hypothetical protein
MPSLGDHTQIGDHIHMKKGSILPLCAAALLAACHGDSGQAPAVDPALQNSAPVAARRGPTPGELTAGMVEAVTIGKSTVPVALKFDLGSRPMVGQPLDVVVAVMPQIAADSAVLLVTGSDGLQVAPDGGPTDMPSVEPTQVYRHNIKTIPTAEGVQLLNIGVSLKHDEITETRAFALPVIVASSTDAANSPKK